MEENIESELCNVFWLKPVAIWYYSQDTKYSINAYLSKLTSLSTTVFKRERPMMTSD